MTESCRTLTALKNIAAFEDIILTEAAKHLLATLFFFLLRLHLAAAVIYLFYAVANMLEHKHCSCSYQSIQVLLDGQSKNDLGQNDVLMLLFPN